MKNDANVPEPQTAAPAETPREKFERERLTRRAALAKIGLRAGATAFAFLSLDDMARMVIGRMAENKEMGQVANTLGREFKNAGVAFADTLVTCEHCCNQSCQDTNACTNQYSYCLRCTNTSSNACDTAYNDCRNNSEYNFVQCYNAHCTRGTKCPPCAVYPDTPCY